MEGTATEVVAVATFFSIVVTKLVDLIRNLTAQVVQGFIPKVTWNFVALGLGVALALTWSINMLDNYSDANSSVQGWVGQLLTGLAIGSASSGYHEVFDLFSSGAKRAKYGSEAAEVARAEMPPLGTG